MADLKMTAENLRFFVRVAVDEYRAGRAKDVGKSLTTIAVYHRALAIARYLRYHDESGFAEGVGRSVQARLVYLRQLGATVPTPPPRYSTTAHNRALYDAIVLGDATSAAELATRGGGRWNSDVEYEDDFLFNDFLHTFFLSESDASSGKAKLQRTAERLEEVKEDPESAEVLICKALLTADRDVFDAGVEGLVAARAKRFATETMMPPELAATERHVFVQGLALVLLARRRGITTRHEYPTIPEPLLALGVSQPLTADQWQRAE